MDIDDGDLLTEFHIWRQVRAVKGSVAREDADNFGAEFLELSDLITGVVATTALGQMAQAAVLLGLAEIALGPRFGCGWTDAALAFYDAGAGMEREAHR